MNFVDFWIIFFLVDVDLAVIFMVWLGVNGTLFVIDFVTLA